MVSSKSRIALDFGCGTGNVTAKLLDLGWRVIAADTSKDMLDILKSKLRSKYPSERLTVRHLEGKNLELNGESLGLITCYSVLHHLYDYMYTLEEFCRGLDDGGVLFIDHEQTDDFWKLQNTFPYRLGRRSSSIINEVYLKRVCRIRPPSMDYTLSDYRTKYQTQINWDEVIERLQRNGFTVRERSYLLHRCVFPNPLHLVCKSLIADTRQVVALKESSRNRLNRSSQ